MKRKKFFTYLVSIKSPDCEKEPKITEFMKKKILKLSFFVVDVAPNFLFEKNS